MNDVFIKKLINFILLTPKDQKMINSLLSSYFVNTKKMPKNNANGRILEIILGKFRSE
jgi:hypothetical protein